MPIVKKPETKIKPRLSCCLIVKNEEKFIESCLNKLFYLADEIIIIENGPSTDQTVTVIKKWVEKYKVSHVVKLFEVGQQFNDADGDFDFGAARTFSFQQATGTHVMWVDCADLIENPREIKRVFKEVLSKVNYPVFFMIYTKMKTISFPRVRITPRLNAKMVGRIHETMFVDKSWKKCIIKQNIFNRENGNSLDRNLKLLLKEWEINKTTRNAFYMANTYFGLNDLENALKWFKIRAYDFINLKETSPEERYKSLEMASDLVIKLIRKKQNNISELLKLSNDMIRFMPSRFEGYYYKAKYLMEKEQWSEALKHLNMHNRCRVPLNTLLWLDQRIYNKKVYLADMEKCQTAIKFQGVLTPDSIFDYTGQTFIPRPTGLFNNLPQKSTYVRGHKQY